MEIKYNDTFSTSHSSDDVFDFIEKDTTILKGSRNESASLPKSTEVNSNETLSSGYKPQSVQLDKPESPLVKGTVVEVKPILLSDPDINIKAAFAKSHTRDFYKGRSFRYAGKWEEGVHYINDEYITDFVVKDEVLLVCKKSNMSSWSNEPTEWVYDHEKIIAVVSDYWEVVLVGGIRGKTYLPEYDENSDSLVWTLVDPESLPEEFQTYLGINDHIDYALVPIKEDILDIKSDSDIIKASIRILEGDIINIDNGLMTLEIVTGRISSRLSDAEENVSQISQSVDEISTRVENQQEDISIINQRADLLRTEVQNVKGDISSLSQRADVIESEVSTLDGEVSTVSQRADQIQSQVENIEGDISTISQRADIIESQVYDQAGDISRISQTADEIQSEVENINGDVSTINQRADLIESAVSNLEGDVTTISQRADSIESRVQNNEGDISNIIQRADSIESTISNIQGDISTIEQNADEISSRVTNTEGDVSRLSQTADAISLEVSNLQGDVSTISQQADAIQSQVENNTGDISTILQRADSIELQVSNLEGDVSLISQSAEEISSRVSNVEGDISNIEQRADSLETRVANNEGGISILEQRADQITSTVQNQQGEISSISQRADQIQSTVESNKQDTDGQISDLNSTIIQTADAIRSEVSESIETLDGEINQTRSEFTQTANEISATVVANKADADGNFQELNSRLTQTAEQIESEVSANKTEADGKFTTINSTLTQQAGLIESKVSQTEYNLKVGEIETNVSSIDQKADNINLSVQQLSSTVDTNARTFADAVTSLQSQIDGAIDTWFYDYAPVHTDEHGVPDSQVPLNVAPYSDWLAAETQTEPEKVRDSHVSDIFYDQDSGYAYRFVGTGDPGSRVYTWVVIQDSAVVKALEDAARAQDTADNKRRVFVTTPTVPYDLGDLWVKTTTVGSIAATELYRCIIAKTESDTANINTDWAVADSYAKEVAKSNIEILADAIIQQTLSYTYDEYGRLSNTTKSAITTGMNDISLAITGSKLETVGIFIRNANVNDNYINLIADKVRIKGTGDHTPTALSIMWDNVANRYKIDVDSLNVDGIFSTSPGSVWASQKSDVLTTSQGYANTAQSNAESTALGYANTAESNAKTAAQGYADTAQSNAISTAATNAATYITNNVIPLINAVDSRVDGLGYLATALNNGTTAIGGGLVLTSLVGLGGNTGTSDAWELWSGIRALEASEPTTGIAAWYGGDAIDCTTIPDWSSMTNQQREAAWSTYRYARSLFRHDGSGYLASNKIWWGASGELYIQDAQIVDGSSSMTTQELIQRVASLWSYFSVVTENGVTYLKLNTSPTGIRGFATEGFISAGGLSQGTGQAGGNASLELTLNGGRLSIAGTSDYLDVYSQSKIDALIASAGTVQTVAGISPTNKDIPVASLQTALGLQALAYKASLVASDIPDLSSTYQPLDNDLTLIAALTGAGLLRRNVNNTWDLDTNAYITGITDTMINNALGFTITGTANNTYNLATISSNANNGNTAYGYFSSGVLPISHGGTNITTYALGDILYASATNTLSKLSGNTTTTKKFLSMIGTGSIASAPIWDVVGFNDLPTMYIGNAPVQSSAQTAQDIGGLGQVTIAGGIKLTTTKKIWFDDSNFIELTNVGTNESPIWALHTNVGLYSDNFVSAGGVSTGSGSSGIDIDAMWDSLTTTSDAHGSDKIASGHIPIATTSTIGGVKIGNGLAITSDGTLSASTGTVTSIAMTVPTGLIVTGSPVTTSGTFAVTFDTGYSIPTDTSQTNWTTAYTTVTTNQAKNKVFASPSNASGAPSFRTLVTADIPSLTVSKISDFPTTWALTNITGAEDLQAIESLSGTNGLLKKTAVNTWVLDTNTYLTGNQTITLSGDVSGSGTTAITVTIGDGKVTNAMLAGNISDSKLNTVGVAKGGTGKTSWTQYGVLYASASDTLSQVENNTTTTRKFLRMVGSSNAATAPVWDVVTKTDVGLSNVENTALSTWTGTNNITTVGTISTGTWEATPIAYNYVAAHYIGRTRTTSSAGNATLLGITAISNAASSDNSDLSRIEWDATNNAWHFIGNIYADGFVSSGGVSSGSGSSGIDADAMWDLLEAPTSEQIALSHLATALSGYYTSTQTNTAISSAITALNLGAASTYNVGTVGNNNSGLVTGGSVYTAINDAIASAIKFQGTTTTAISDGSTINPITINNQSYTAKKGDVVLYDGKEYLWTSTAWEQLGDEASWALKTVTISAGTGLSGGGNLTTNRTISLSASTITSLALADSAYQKPSTGIPKTDLAQAVQDSLGLADSALQSHQSIYELTLKVGSSSIGTFKPKVENKTLTITSTHLKGVLDSIYQPLDEDLTAIAALTGPASGQAFLKRKNNNTWVLDTNVYLTGNETITLSGDVSGSGTTAITTTIGEGKVTNAMLAGSIANAKLQNSEITINGSSTSLGGSFNTANITSGTIGTSSATSGYTLSVPYATVNEYGIVTGYGTHTHTINNIPNSSLVNDSVTIGSTEFELGSTHTTLEGLTKIVSSTLSIGGYNSDNTESTITWDDTHKAWKVTGNLYATGFISSGGISSGSGSSGIDPAVMWDYLTNDTTDQSYYTTKIHTDHLPNITITGNNIIGGSTGTYSYNQGVSTLTLNINTADTTYNVVTDSIDGLVPAYSSTNKATSSTGDYYFLGWTGNVLKWYSLPANAFKDTWTAWVGATSSSNGTAGYMPAPTSAQRNQFLRGDGSWVSLNNYSLPVAADGTLGGIQIGYTTDDTNRNYAVQLSNNKAYVHIPWIEPEPIIPIADAIGDIKSSILGINESIIDLSVDIDNINAYEINLANDLSTIFSYFDTLGNAKTALKLTTTGPLNIWGVQYWNNGVPNSVTGRPTLYIGSTQVQTSNSETQALAGITTITASGQVTVGSLKLGSNTPTLTWDTQYNAWHLSGNFYADGWVSSGGVSTGSGSGGIDPEAMWALLAEDDITNKISTTHLKLGANLTTDNGDIELSNTGVTAGTYRSVTVDAYGRVTSGTNPTTVDSVSLTSGTNNGTLKLTVNGTDIDNIAVKGLGNAAYKGLVDSSSASAIGTGSSVTTERDIYYGLPTINGAHNYTSNTNLYAPTAVGSQYQYLMSNGSGAPSWQTPGAVESGNNYLVTGGAVWAAIDDLPEPMVFKGSLGTNGTIQILPAASPANDGFTYKVITAGTYAGQAAKVGDTFISNGTEWVLIPSGDEPEGTVTSVGLSVPTGLSVTGSPITTSGTLAITFTSGYSIPTDAAQTAWSAKYDKPSTGIPNGDLENSSITLAGRSVSLGGSISVTNMRSDLSISNVENTKLSTWAGTTNITTLGTITTGVWHGTAIANQYLANSSITIGSTSISLGGTSTTIAGLTAITSSKFYLSSNTYFELDSDGYVHLVTPSNKGFYTDGFISSGGISDGSGSAGIDPSALWDYLKNESSDHAYDNEKIAIAHIPDIASTYGYIKSVSLVEGNTNGTIHIVVDGNAGSDIAIHGLGSAAYADASDFANAIHTHTVSDITDFPTTWAWADITGAPSTMVNPYSLTFGSKSYDGSSAVSLSASDLGALTSHQIVTLASGTNNYTMKLTTAAGTTDNVPVTGLALAIDTLQAQIDSVASRDMFEELYSTSLFSDIGSFSTLYAASIVLNGNDLATTLDTFLTSVPEATSSTYGGIKIGYTESRENYAVQLSSGKAYVHVADSIPYSDAIGAVKSSIKGLNESLTDLSMDIDSINALLASPTIEAIEFKLVGGAPVMTWDSTNQAWHLNGNFYADGFVSSGGASSGSSSGGIDIDAMWLSLTTTSDSHGPDKIAVGHIPDLDYVNSVSISSGASNGTIKLTVDGVASADISVTGLADAAYRGIANTIGSNITGLVSGSLLYGILGDSFDSSNTVKAFVNSSIATATATFRGTNTTATTESAFITWANSLTHNLNDYVFWQTVDSDGNTLYKRYKYDGTNWVFEYTLNNSSFTSAQWSAISSGITSSKVSSYDAIVGYFTNGLLQASHVGDLSAIYALASHTHTISQITDLQSELDILSARIDSIASRDMFDELYATVISSDIVATTTIYGSLIGNADTATTASKLSTSGPLTIWGVEYWNNGTPKSVSGDMSSVGSISMNGSISGVTTIGASGQVTIGSLKLGSNTPTLSWDNDHNAWHLTGNFYADGFISSGGLSTGGGASGIDEAAMWTALQSNNGEGTNKQLHSAHLPTCGNGLSYTVDSNGIATGINVSFPVTSIIGNTGAVTAAQIATGLTDAGYKLTDHEYSLLTTSANGLAPAYASGNQSTSSSSNTYYFLGWTGSTMKWYSLPANAFNDHTYTLEGLMGSSAKGGTTQPIYWDGTEFKNTTYTLSKSVPSNAVFTDTTYSNGTGISLSGTTFSLDVAGTKAALGLGSLAYKSSLVVADIPDLSGTYLPLTGGTLQSAGEYIFNINNSTVGGTNCWQYFKVGGTNKASVGYYNGLAYIANETSLGRIGVNDSGTPQYWPGTSSSAAQTLLHTGNYSTYTLPLAGGTMTGTLKLTPGVGISESSNDNGLLVYHPSDWSGVTNTQWGVGTIDSQGVIRSSNTNLWHYRYGSGTYVIFDESNANKSDVSWTTAHLDAYGSIELRADGSSWNEGIRMHPAANGWSGIAFCEASNSGSTGTSANTWSIHNHEGVFGMYKNGSNKSDTNVYLDNTSGAWGMGGSLTIAGSLSTTGDQIITSDETKKTNLKDIKLSVRDIASVRAVTFDWKDGSGHSYGTIAQDWLGILPEAVHGKEGNYSFAYAQAALVSSVVNAREIVSIETHETEQDKEIKMLKEKIKKLEIEIELLKMN